MSPLRGLGLVVGLVIFVSAVRLVQRRTLREKYAIMWMLVGVGQLVLAILPGALDATAGLLGVADPPNLLAFLSVIFLLGVTAQLTLESSQLADRTRTLAEEVAILRRKVEELGRDSE